MMSDDFDEMAGMPPCPACSDSAPDFCSKHSPHTYHSKSEMRRHEAQKQDPLEAAAMGYAKAYNPKGYTDAGILAFKAGAAWAYEEVGKMKLKNSEYDFVASHVSYNPETGKVTRLSTGKEFNYIDKNGYVRVSIGSAYYKAHRIAFLLTYRRLPKYIDHINRDRADNRIANLREADAFENARNSSMRKLGSSEYRGVHKAGDRYRAAISIGKITRRKHLGYFADPITAAETYDEAALVFHGDFATLNFPEKLDLYLSRIAGRKAVKEPADEPAPQVSVEDEAEADYFSVTEDEDYNMDKRDYHERGYQAGHASGRRSRDAEVAELKSEVNHQSRMYVKLAEINDKLTAELAEARAELLLWSKEQPDFLANETRLKNEREALKSQLTQAQADVAELVRAVEADLAERKSFADSSDPYRYDVAMALKRVKGRS